jgi:DNA-binding response OmpR family regulator
MALALLRAGYHVHETATAEDGLRVLAAQDVDGVCVDVVLPGRDGTSSCRAVRERSQVPVIVVTALGDTADVVEGLRSGAEDHISTPFAMEELVARLEALLRRTGGAPGEVVRVGAVEIHPQHGLVLREGRPVALTRTEGRLLCDLASAPGTTSSREELLQTVWGHVCFGDSRLVDVHVGRLRRKVEADPADPVVVQTVRGIRLPAGPLMPRRAPRWPPRRSSLRGRATSPSRPWPSPWPW